MNKQIRFHAKRLLTVLFLTMLILSFDFKTPSLASSSFTIGNYEWMQISDITYYSWDNFDELFDEDGHGISGKELNNQNLNGWNWATSVEVDEFIFDFIAGFETEHDGDPLVYIEWETNVANQSVMERFFQNYGVIPTDTASSNHSFHQGVRGFTRDTIMIDGEEFATVMYAFDYENSWYQTYDTHYPVEMYTSTTSPIVGAWIYREVNSVPVPNSLSILGVGLFSIACVRRYRKLTSFN